MSDSVTLERARSQANEARWAVALQRGRLLSVEPEDELFVCRRSVDAQFLIVALRRLRRAVELAARVSFVADALKEVLVRFDDSVPALKTMRNVGEHIR